MIPGVCPFVSLSVRFFFVCLLVYVSGRVRQWLIASLLVVLRILRHVHIKA